jgi:hypothetical protein
VGILDFFEPPAAVEVADDIDFEAGAHFIFPETRRDDRGSIVGWSWVLCQLIFVRNGKVSRYPFVPQLRDQG